MSEFTKEQFFIVTGASSGLGEATALELNKQGASVIAIARREDKLKELKSKCANPDNLYIEVKDLSQDIDNLSGYIKTLKEQYGKFRGMAYCAGVGLITPIRSLTYQDTLKLFNINYFAPLFMAKGILDKRNNIGKGFSLVCIASSAGVSPSKGQCVYSGSKGALIMSMKTISKEVSSYGARVNCVSPSIIKTPMTVNDEGILKDDNKEKYPFGWGEPQDVANMICYLLSDKAKYISGQNYVIDSGGSL